MSKTYYIGWDVGAWHTKKKDGLWILSCARNGDNGELKTVGVPRSTAIQTLLTQPEPKNLHAFLISLLEECDSEEPELTSGDRVVMGIDACFKFPSGIVKLAEGSFIPEFKVTGSIKNAYLYRPTELVVSKKSILKKRKRSPLSPIQSAIGSQAAKAQHFLARYGFEQEGAAWKTESEGVRYSAIEVYPATSKKGGKFGDGLLPDFIQEQYMGLTSGVDGLTEDSRDALICALVACLYDRDDESLLRPDDHDCSEGWIWFPKVPDSCNA